MIDAGTAGMLAFFACAAAGLALTLCRSVSRRRRAALADDGFATLVGRRALDGMVVSDMAGRVLWVNDAYCRLTRLPRARIIGRHPWDFAVSEELRPDANARAGFRFTAADDGTLAVHRNVRGDGTETWVEISTAIVEEASSPGRAVMVCRDATEKIQRARELAEAYERIEKVAHTDPLTGLANRGEFLRVAGAGLVPGLPALGLLHLDVDRFKEVNDSAGHPAGDAVLCHVARVLQATARSSDTVARLGGDEFVVVCPGVGDACTLEALAQRIVERLSAPLAYHGRLVPCGVSIGGALAEGGDLRPEDLLSRSDAALYAAKRAGRGRVRIHDAAMHRATLAERRLREELRLAVRDGRLDFAFQPTMDMQTGGIRGFETRLRCRNGRTVAGATDTVAGLARDLGLSVDIDMAAMEAALAMQARLRRETGRQVLVGFNASPDLLAHPDVLHRLRDGLAAHGVPADCLVVELPEAVFFGNDADRASHGDVLRRLHRLGVRLLLDDFGMGYAGLSHLATLPITAVKLDRTLMCGIETDPRRAEIVSTLCRLAGRLDLHMVVEGVDRPAQVEFLRGLGRVAGQGTAISPPLSAGDVPAFVALHGLVEVAASAAAPAPTAATRASA